MFFLSEYIIQARESEQKQKLHLSQFIDDFRSKKDVSVLDLIYDIDPQTLLFVATAHQLCIELGLKTPDWMKKTHCLESPFFVSKMPSINFLALRDSAYAFKIRNIFVPHNFLHRT